MSAIRYKDIRNKFRILTASSLKFQSSMSAIRYKECFSGIFPEEMHYVSILNECN